MADQRLCAHRVGCALPRPGHRRRIEVAGLDSDHSRRDLSFAREGRDAERLGRGGCFRRGRGSRCLLELERDRTLRRSGRDHQSHPDPVYDRNYAYRALYPALKEVLS